MAANSTTWAPGSGSRNPGGRQRMDPILKKKIRAMSPEIFDKLLTIVNMGETDAAKVAAARLILAYAWGSPENGQIDESEDRPREAELSIEEKRALARLALSTETPALGDGSNGAH